MNRKKLFALVAVISLLVTVTMYFVESKYPLIEGLYWIPLLLSAGFLLASNRLK